MQDGAPGHRAGTTIEDLRERGIIPIFWPAFSPDLNPIESVWNRMKQWIEEEYGDIHFTNYDRLREAVLAAWRAIPQDWLDDLVKSMRDRCQAVIDAEGYHTKY